MTISGVTPFLWFDEQAQEAAEFYVALFPDSRITSVSYYGEGAQKPAGTVLTVVFELFGQPFAALNGGPDFHHSEAVSFQVFCDTQDEVDHLWGSLLAGGGAEGRCGWCKDRFGVSWQVIPRRLTDLLTSPEPAVSQKAFAAMLPMHRIVLADLDAAVAR